MGFSEKEAPSSLSSKKPRSKNRGFFIWTPCGLSFRGYSRDMGTQCSYRIGFSVGPCAVKELASKVEAAGLKVFAGTEVLWVTSSGSDLIDALIQVQDTVKVTHGRDLGINRRALKEWHRL